MMSPFLGLISYDQWLEVILGFNNKLRICLIWLCVDKNGMVTSIGVKFNETNFVFETVMKIKIVMTMLEFSAHKKT